MSKAEILAELPRLSEPERAEIFECLWDLEGTSGPTEHEKALLNEAQDDYDANPDDGSPWPDVDARLRAIPCPEFPHSSVSAGLKGPRFM